jgi:hypothetical protein
MKSATLLLVTTVGLAVGAVFPTMGGARAAEPASPLAGHWRAAETPDERGQRLQAVDEATDHLGRFQRNRARSRLAERTSPPPRLTIAIEESTVTVTSGDRRLEVEPGGVPVEVDGNQGKARVSAQMEDKELTLLARADEGDRTTVYRASGDTLTVEVTMTAPNLAGALKYRSTYIRVK